MVGMGEKEHTMAYEYVFDSESKRYRKDCSDILKETCALLKKKGIIAQFYLVGSGARKMITRNGNGPYDLDYNLEIVRMADEYRKDLRHLKDTVRVALDKGAELDNCFDEAQDSTSCLTAIMHFNDSPQVEFKVDVAIVMKNDNGTYMRLIHNKSVISWDGRDQYTWNEIPNSHEVKEKAKRLKEEDLWREVRDRYLELKNLFLSRNDKSHPSFVVYVMAVNDVYQKCFRSNRIVILNR